MPNFDPERKYMQKTSKLNANKRTNLMQITRRRLKTKKNINILKYIIQLLIIDNIFQEKVEEEEHEYPEIYHIALHHRQYFFRRRLKKKKNMNILKQIIQLLIIDNILQEKVEEEEEHKYPEIDHIAPHHRQYFIGEG